MRGLFGRIENEIFYYRGWHEVTAEGFIDRLDAYLQGARQGVAGLNGPDAASGEPWLGRLDV